MNQFEMMKEYSKKINVINEDIFNKSEYNIIKYLINLVKSCQRYYSFYLNLDSYNIIDNLDSINRILYNYEDGIIKNKKKKKYFVNIYSYNNIKTTEMILLGLNFTYGLRDSKWGYNRSKHTSYIIIPRFIDRYYFKLTGKLYSPEFQIIENTTYNMSKKTDTVIYKCTFMKLSMYRNKCKLKGNSKPIIGISFVANIFGKDIYGHYYILAKIGLENSIRFLGLENTFSFSKEPANDTEKYYSFKGKSDFYIIIPKYLFDNNEQIQAFIVCIIKSNIKYNNLYDIKSWINNLGKNFSEKYTFEKGLSVLESLEGMYDQNIQKSCNLPYEFKKNIYCMLRWLMYEFSELMQKDNLDLRTKKLRCEEYIAQLYGTKLSTNVRKISEMKNNISMYDIRKYINIRPDYLLSEIKKCSIINFKNISSDHDVFLGAKYTFKGPGGIDSSTKGSKIPDKYKQLNLSHLGVLGLSNTHPKTPGIQGTLIPTLNLKRFASYQEPNTWFSDMSNLINDYNSNYNENLSNNSNYNYDNKWDDILDEYYNVNRKPTPIIVKYKNKENPIKNQPPLFFINKDDDGGNIDE